MAFESLLLIELMSSGNAALHSHTSPFLELN